MPAKTAKTQTRHFDIGPGDSVTIRTPHGQERTGKAVMRSSYGGWVLNMGGQHGVAALADVENIVRVRKARKPGPRINPEKAHQCIIATIHEGTDWGIFRATAADVKSGDAWSYDAAVVEVRKLIGNVKPGITPARWFDFSDQTYRAGRR